MLLQLSATAVIVRQLTTAGSPIVTSKLYALILHYASNIKLLDRALCLNHQVAEWVLR